MCIYGEKCHPSLTSVSYNLLSLILAYLCNSNHSLILTPASLPYRSLFFHLASLYILSLSFNCGVHCYSALFITLSTLQPASLTLLSYGLAVDSFILVFTVTVASLFPRPLHLLSYSPAAIILAPLSYSSSFITLTPLLLGPHSHPDPLPSLLHLSFLRVFLVLSETILLSHQLPPPQTSPSEPPLPPTPASYHLLSVNSLPPAILPRTAPESDTQV